MARTTVTMNTPYIPSSTHPSHALNQNHHFSMQNLSFFNAEPSDSTEWSDLHKIYINDLIYPQMIFIHIYIETHLIFNPSRAAAARVTTRATVWNPKQTWKFVFKSSFGIKKFIILNKRYIILSVNKIIVLNEKSDTSSEMSMNIPDVKGVGNNGSVIIR